MNPFSLNLKNPDTKIPQRIKIKSKYFGQYEPQVFIASRSKSKSRSTSKDDINSLMTKKSPQYFQTIKIETQKLPNNAETVTINPQTSKSPRLPNSGSLSEYLLARSASPGRKKSGSAIEKIVEWVERKYFERIKNRKLDNDTSLSLLRDQKYNQGSEQQKVEEKFRKFAYDVFILSRLKGPRSTKQSPLTKTKKSLIVYNQIPTKYESKEHDIDNINISPLNQVSKAEDFDIYKFKKNPNYSTDVNLMRISQLSIENINRSGQKTINEYLPDKEQFSSKKKKFQIPTMNTLQNLDQKSTGQVQSQKDMEIGFIDYQPKTFFVETARSTSTNEMMELSKNSISSSSIAQKDKLLTNADFLKTGPLYEGNLKISININNDLNQIKSTENQQLTLKKDPELSPAEILALNLSNKLKNQTGLCEVDHWPNALFHPEKISENVNPTQVDTFSVIDERSEQILNQIFQMNEDQQHILKTIGNKQSSLLFSSIKEQKPETLQKSDSIINKINPNKDSNVSKSRKSFAENYFTMHLGVDSQQNQVKTYEMPLVKANNNYIVKMAQKNPSNIYNLNKIITQNKSPNKQVFTFNSLNPHDQDKNNKTKQKSSLQNKKAQANAFVQNCNLFGLCSGDNRKQLQRSNYFSQLQTSGRDRGVSANSNQSKTSSKPKVSFNYISPSSKQINILGKDKQSESSILFKSQASQLKNTGKAPVKIDIKPSRERKGNEEIAQSIVKEVIPPQVREFRAQSVVVEQKERSQSVPHFTVQKPMICNPQMKIELSKQHPKVKIEQKASVKNAFVNPGQGPSYYYQSQKLITNAHQNQPSTMQSNYQSVHSYYFPGVLSPHMGTTQVVATKGFQLESTSSLKKDKQAPTVHRNDQRYLYPIQQSIQKQRNQRAKSLCKKIMITVKKSQC